MLGHFIPHKGKGMLVLVLPLLAGVVLFFIFDAVNINDRYVLPIALLFSAFFIWFFDGGPALLRDGFSNVPKSRHTLFWIDIKYWALAIGILGCVLLGNFF